jgi:hypothetical protein
VSNTQLKKKDYPYWEWEERATFLKGNKQESAPASKEGCKQRKNRDSFKALKKNFLNLMGSIG